MTGPFMITYFSVSRYEHRNTSVCLLQLEMRELQDGLNSALLHGERLGQAGEGDWQRVQGLVSGSRINKVQQS